MAGMATLTMLLSRYVMKVASATATSVHRFAVHDGVSFTLYIYAV